MRSKARLDRWTVPVCVCVQTTTWLSSRVYREHWGSGVGGGKREKEKRNTATTTVVSHCICTAKYSDENSLVPSFNTSQLVSFLNWRATYAQPARSDSCLCVCVCVCGVIGCNSSSLILEQVLLASRFRPQILVLR